MSAFGCLLYYIPSQYKFLKKHLISSQRFLFSLDFWILKLKFICISISFAKQALSRTDQSYVNSRCITIVSGYWHEWSKEWRWYWWQWCSQVDHKRSHRPTNIISSPVHFLSEVGEGSGFCSRGKDSISIGRSGESLMSEIWNHRNTFMCMYR